MPKMPIIEANTVATGPDIVSGTVRKAYKNTPTLMLTTSTDHTIVARLMSLWFSIRLPIVFIVLGMALSKHSLGT